MLRLSHNRCDCPMISEDQAKDLFKPVQKDLNQIVLKSWNKIHRSELHFKSRSRASLMWDETFYLANIAWCDSNHIDKIEEKKSQTAYYWFNDKTLFRIKKGDKQGYTRNYPTQTALEFYHPQSELFDLVDRLEVTYVLNHDETKIDDIAVVHRMYGNISFRFSILETENVEALPHTDSKKFVDTAGVAKLKTGIENPPKTESLNEK